MISENIEDDTSNGLAELPNWTSLHDLRPSHRGIIIKFKRSARVCANRGSPLMYRRSISCFYDGMIASTHQIAGKRKQRARMYCVVDGLTVRPYHLDKRPGYVSNRQPYGAALQSKNNRGARASVFP
jgi:hypothetical protein